MPWSESGSPPCPLSPCGSLGTRRPKEKDMQPHGLKFIKTFSLSRGESISLWDVGPLNLQKPSVVRLRSINSSKIIYLEWWWAAPLQCNFLITRWMSLPTGKKELLNGCWFCVYSAYLVVVLYLQVHTFKKHSGTAWVVWYVIRPGSPLSCANCYIFFAIKWDCWPDVVYTGSCISKGNILYPQESWCCLGHKRAGRQIHMQPMCSF